MAVTICIPAVLAYNWWLIVPFRHGLLTSVNSFFSDLEVKGAPDAGVFGKLDVIAGALFLAALLLSHRARTTRHAPSGDYSCLRDRRGRRRTVSLLLRRRDGLRVPDRGMAPAIAVPPLRARAAVRSRIPLRHDCTAARMASHATKRCPASRPKTEHFAGWQPGSSSSATPPLAIAYFSDRYAALVEPVYFLAFSLAAFTEVVANGHIVNGDVIIGNVVNGYSIESRHHRRGRADDATTAVSYSDRGRR